MDKRDLKKELKGFYDSSAKGVSIVDVPGMNFIMIEGKGAPESQHFQQAIEALYPIAYTIKFNKKKTDGSNYVIMPLEGLWWAEDMSFFNKGKADRNEWQWKLMIMQPEFITITDFKLAQEMAIKKRGILLSIVSVLKNLGKVNALR
jgi:hypothetical protein